MAARQMAFRMAFGATMESLRPSQEQTEMPADVPALFFPTIREVVEHETGMLIEPESIMGRILRRYEGNGELFHLQDQQPAAQDEHVEDSLKCQASGPTSMRLPESGSLEDLCSRRRREGRRLWSSSDTAALNRELQKQRIMEEKAARTRTDTIAHRRVTRHLNMSNAGPEQWRLHALEFFRPRARRYEISKRMKGGVKRSGYPGLGRHSNARLQQEFNRQTLRLYRLAGVRSADLANHRKEKHEVSLREWAITRAGRELEHMNKHKRIQHLCEKYVLDIALNKEEGGYPVNVSEGDATDDDSDDSDSGSDSGYEEFFE
jgi:hypothetical protein